MRWMHCYQLDDLHDLRIQKSSVNGLCQANRHAALSTWLFFTMIGCQQVSRCHDSAALDLYCCVQLTVLASEHKMNRNGYRWQGLH